MACTLALDECRNEIGDELSWRVHALNIEEYARLVPALQLFFDV